MRTLRHTLPLLPLIVGLACARSTAPGASSDAGGATFDGTWDPDAGSFVLQRVTTVVPGFAPIVIELVGSNVEADPVSGRVSVEVAVHNAGTETVHAPAIVWLSDFRPDDVVPLNADVLLPDTNVPGERAWGFAYDDLLGSDRALEPGETSDGKIWRFEAPGAAPFAFAARAEFALSPRSHLSGVVFVDQNQNGEREADEPLFEHGWFVRLITPEGVVREAKPRGGRYGFVVEKPGLYRVELVVLIEPVSCLTTPNPLEVVLTPGPDGDPQSYEDADFGFAFGPCFEPVPPLVLTDRNLHEIEPQHRYDLIGLGVHGDVLELRVGFSGCSADHPFQLYASDELRWPVPGDVFVKPVSEMVLAHDDRGEPCDAYFERTLAFDISPLRALYPGTIWILFRDWGGNKHDLSYEP